jgi:hypothetical protein
MADDPIIQRIESFRCRRGQLFAERRNRGYTLYRASLRWRTLWPVMRTERGHGHAMVEWMPPDRVDGLYSARDLISEKEEDDESWRGLSADRTRR